MNRKCLFALGLMLLLPLVTLACGSSSYVFDSNVRKLSTDIDPSPLMVEEVMQIPWGNGDGEVAHNPESSEHAGLEYIPGPHNIYVDSTGRFYVDDPFNKRVVLFNENGGFVRNYAYPEEGEPRSAKPAHILAGDDGVFISSPGTMKFIPMMLMGR